MDSVDKQILEQAKKVAMETIEEEMSDILYNGITSNDYYRVLNGRKKLSECLIKNFTRLRALQSVNEELKKYQDQMLEKIKMSGFSLKEEKETSDE
jgi:hypothetical protein